jgi:hypothetical protein
LLSRRLDVHNNPGESIVATDIQPVIAARGAADVPVHGDDERLEFGGVSKEHGSAGNGAKGPRVAGRDRRKALATSLPAFTCGQDDERSQSAEQRSMIE